MAPDRLKLFRLLGWIITLAVTAFMIRDVSPDLRQAPWVVKANAGLGIPADLIPTIGVAGLACALLYVVPQTSMIGSIGLTGFLGGAVLTHLRVHGDASDVAENVFIGMMAWAGLWLRDARLRALLPIRSTSGSSR